ncbi:MULTISPECIES: FxSxx-COOH cyclophane-containing RiPP peptide [unclassified Streptomyces]|uniref:FxSxx-COOH cyclophane-containing RiPP peptide n=1 Tax=unclassified Streptomyces TaxID=2593676 RepID=UPI002E0DC55B|nr:FxSxx-COOH protein [Streptomyces sp. NBC_01320]
MGESREVYEPSRSAVDGGPGGELPELPDLLELDLETLRTLDHPVLAAVVADLRGRANQPREMLWGFTSAL